MKAHDWIHHLRLEPHPEGGYFREVYRNPDTLQLLAAGTRHLATSIYFLLAGEQKSHFHQLESDELWYFHTGSAVTVHIFEDNRYRQEQLGLRMDEGESPQVFLPRKSIFAAEVNDRDSFALMSCMVNPGFDFKDFRLLEREELEARFPNHRDLIRSFTLEPR